MAAAAAEPGVRVRGPAPAPPRLRTEGAPRQGEGLAPPPAAVNGASGRRAAVGAGRCCGRERPAASTAARGSSAAVCLFSPVLFHLFSEGCNAVLTDRQEPEGRRGCTHGFNVGNPFIRSNRLTQFVLNQMVQASTKADIRSNTI